MRNLLIGLVCLGLFAACKEQDPLYDGLGKQPVYMSYEELTDIRNEEIQPVINSGPVFLRDPYLFMVEKKQGIHVFQISNSSDPQPVTFLKIPGVNDFTLTGDLLYADNGPNLVTINISDIMNIQVVSIQTDMFKPILFPPDYEGFFECADPSKGFVSGWKDAFITNAACQTW
jgi:hypothetical protein